jgi:DNA-binding transcriptional LysR family regulator
VRIDPQRNFANAFSDQAGLVGLHHAHKDYLRRRGTPQSQADLLQHDLIGNDQQQTIVRGLAAFGINAGPADFALRTDDLMAYWAAVQAGLGIGFVADYLARSNPQVTPLLTTFKIPPLPVWLAVHREIRTNPRIRAVYDFLGAALPGLL